MFAVALTFPAWKKLWDFRNASSNFIRNSYKRLYNFMISQDFVYLGKNLICFWLLAWHHLRNAYVLHHPSSLWYQLWHLWWTSKMFNDAVACLKEKIGKHGFNNAWAINFNMTFGLWDLIIIDYIVCYEAHNFDKYDLTWTDVLSCWRMKHTQYPSS